LYYKSKSKQKCSGIKEKERNEGRKKGTEEKERALIKI